jgi:hypothetical protein
VDVEIFDYDGHWRKKQTLLSEETLTDIIAKFREAEFHWRCDRDDARQIG